MAKNSAANLLTSVDSLFTTQAERDEAKRETVVKIPLDEISDFPNHPFKVREDDSMTEMVESIKVYGVLVPGLVRPKPDGGYEMVAGHRRKMASRLAGKADMDCIVRDLTDDEAIIIMVDSNLQRDQLLPSEKAFAYKMKLDAMRRQAGRPSKENSCPVGADLIGTRSDERLAENSPDSARQI
ncbi:MAG: ParB/RepB/Spo0J family partition protein, partial [Oscillospiraceae bacterium]|nr:ParB/RepB/Spo0J family partition protein [Oscillospiraceae bacterium]